jgi:hypothetical protein
MNKLNCNVGIHFAYQHPIFGRTGKLSVAYERSIYYWWWRYLKRNTAYLECCERGGTGDMASLYEDFGDVRGQATGRDDFLDWWRASKRGERLFGEPLSTDSVRILAAGDTVPGGDGHLTVVLPLSVPRRDLQKKLNALFKLHHRGKRGKQAAKCSRARYKVDGQPNIRALKLALEVYEFKLSNPTLKYWEIGKNVPGVFHGNWDIKKGDTKSKRAKLSSKVSQYLNRAEKSIRRVGDGLCPIPK